VRQSRVFSQCVINVRHRHVSMTSSTHSSDLISVSTRSAPDTTSMKVSLSHSHTGAVLRGEVGKGATPPSQRSASPPLAFPQMEFLVSAFGQIG